MCKLAERKDKEKFFKIYLKENHKNKKGVETV